MESSNNGLARIVEDFFNAGKYENILSLLSDEELEKVKDKREAAELYVWRGNTRYYEKYYEEAIQDYNKAIDNSPVCALAFYNRGYASIKKEKFSDAIQDFEKVIEIDSNYVDAYVAKGSVLRYEKEYGKAISDYDKAIEINPKFASAYYNRGLTKLEGNLELDCARKDFEKYRELIDDVNDGWLKYVDFYIDRIDERMCNESLPGIASVIDDIKNVLFADVKYITHYTSLSALKSLILYNNSFRLSEGNFMNDPSEGKELFNFLEFKHSSSHEEGAFEFFSSKPYIGSFVTEDKCDDLNLWRFYGKEDGVEARGCAITFDAKKFIDDVNGSQPQEDGVIQVENDIELFYVAYFNAAEKNFYIPDIAKCNELNRLMTELKNKVKYYAAQNYKESDKKFLERNLNRIAFLFKSDAYKNENEVRMVVQGFDFKKNHDGNKIPPQVYIELKPIKERIKTITLGPKVDKVNAWASFFFSSYERDHPQIMISHLPYR